jgi:hypothetical protein
VFAAVVVFLLGRPVRAETDLMMRAVGFALTGRDDADPKVIDRASCVFAIENELFRLNNVYTDRLKNPSTAAAAAAWGARAKRYGRAAWRRNYI